jgi:hypothetical protein
MVAGKRVANSAVIYTLQLLTLFVTTGIYVTTADVSRELGRHICVTTADLSRNCSMYHTIKKKYGYGAAGKRVANSIIPDKRVANSSIPDKRVANSVGA